ncbi:MAG TPA: thioredoxin-like domain-containing protein [Abditibacteriaceae bacterium]|jgi:DNA-binding beta-propeller fold protein YncE
MHHWLGRSNIAVSAALTFALIIAVVVGTQRKAPQQLKTDSNVAEPIAPVELSSAVNAPEFPSGFTWINTEKPLSLRALRGKIVLLDFWTYGCINCMHILPDLKKLERKYPNELVVIGVHSAKFANEGEGGNIRNAVMRYNIEHPVLVDRDMRVWNSFGVNAWPTFVLIDPAGNVVGQVAGEGNFGVLDSTISRVAKQFRQSGKLNVTPVKFALEAARVAATPLRYPGKVLADAASNRLFIADTNHNRIVISDLNGNVKAVAGSGEMGLQDGAFDLATFRSPQGMALGANKSVLYVADTENHAIRALDLNKGTVTTLAGTGQQAPWRSTGGVGTGAQLASPWDVEQLGDTLYIAMAGPHQIWAMNLKTRRVGPYAGSGQEARIDGSLQSAALAQPSDLATDGQKLFFADSESSSVRTVDLQTQEARSARVRTLAGGGAGPNLFDFGDVDGSGTGVRLQHPLGVEYSAGRVYVADTYNHKIKAIDLQNNSIETLTGKGGGHQDGPARAAQFYEPGGLSLAGTRLFVADTNNHAIRVIDLNSKQVSTLQLKNVPQPAPAEPSRPLRAVNPDEGTITLALAKLAPNTQGQLVLDVKLPARHHLNKESPQRFTARVEGNGVTLSKTTIPTKDFKLPLVVPISTKISGQGSAIVNTTVFYCTDDQGACLVRQMRVRVPFELAQGGSSKLTVPLEITSGGEVKARTVS